MNPWKTIVLVSLILFAGCVGQERESSPFQEVSIRVVGMVKAQGIT